MAARYHQVHEKLGIILKNNFIGGIAWGLGATIGASIVVALLGLILKNINLIPVVGNFVSQIIDFVLKNNQSLVK